MAVGDRPEIRAKAWAAGVDGARRRAAAWLPDGWAEHAESLRRLAAEWLVAETAPGRLLPWLPVAFGTGIALYFTADREPAWWAALAVTIASVAIAVVARRRPVGFPVALGVAAITCGFCLATVHTVRIAHPVLQASTWTAQVAGFVETRQEREKSDRIVVRVHRFDAARVTEKPERVRVSVRKGTAPAVGDYVAFKAHLSPPLAPLRPDGYDFARDMYFQQIGASGYVLGRIKAETPAAERGFWLRYAAFIDACAVDFRLSHGGGRRASCSLSCVPDLLWSRRWRYGVVHPSFQMSFAATLALVAVYQYGLPGGPFWRADHDTPFGARAALWGGREVTALLLASLIAGLATMPYAAYHFHRVAPYGVLANLLAMPVVSAMVMPMGILGVLTMPFGFDGLFWKLMGAGLDWMIGVALWVTNLPGSVGYLPAFGVGPLLLGTSGILLICLLRTPLRWSGAALGIVACLWALGAPRPDVLMAADGQSAAIRGAGGRLQVLASGRDTFAVKEWLAADGDPRKPGDASLKQGVRCDAIGCTATLANGRLVAFAQSAESFEEDCVRAAAVLSPRDAPSACRATLVDRRVWRAQGATALFWNGEGFEQVAARPANVDRPWARATRRTDVSEMAPSPRRPSVPDATPPADAIEADD